MSETSILLPDGFEPSRRRFLSNTGKATLSAAAVALIMGNQALAHTKDAAMMGSPEQDVSILNIALGLEHEAIGAYQIGAESGLLTKPILAVAVSFQSQHKEHRDAVDGAIRQLGGKAVDTKSLKDYATALKANTLKSETDVLKLAARLERGAANAYLGVIPSFSDPALAQVAGRLAADETMHWTVLAQVLGISLPTKALTFGA